MSSTTKNTNHTKDGMPVRFFFTFMCLVCFAVQNSFATEFSVLKPADFAYHIKRFNSMEDENVTNLISNADSWNWLQKEIPFFECPDREVEELYYFRWWSFRKHRSEERRVGKECR